MGKCQWMITKGSKKGETCGIYSKKKNDGKYYCASHHKMITILNDVENTPEIVKKEPKKEAKKHIKNENKSEEKEDQEDDENPSLETHSLDFIIEHEYQKALKKDKSKNKLEEKVDYLMKKMNELFPPKKSVYLNDYDSGIPKIEIFN